MIHKNIQIVFLTVCLFFVSDSYSQRAFGDELELTETRFALESQIQGLKWGFLHNMDTGAIGLYPQGFVNLYQKWQARPDDVGFILQWQPKSVFWSRDGLFGMTTGPAITEPKPDSALAHTGYFFTIWKRSNTSEPFKIILDVGVPLAKPASPMLLKNIPVKRVPVNMHRQNKQAAASVNTPVVSTAFAHTVLQHTLKNAIQKYAHAQSDVLVYGHGVLSKADCEKAGFLEKKFHFSGVSVRPLGGACYYEWGRLQESAHAPDTTGYFAHVWSLEEKNPVLLVALYQF